MKNHKECEQKRLESAEALYKAKVALAIARYEWLSRRNCMCK